MTRPTDTDTDTFERLRPRLVALSRRIVGSTADAEDVVQDCFLKWRDADRAALATPAAWLTTVVQRQSIDRLRRRARETQAAHPALERAPAAPPAAPDDALLRRADVAEALARLLARLSPSERLALVLFDVFECSHADIAAALGTTPANARQRLARARRRLRLPAGDAAPDEKLSQLSRELVRRFHAALDGLDVPAIVNLLGGAQPLAVRASANDAIYRLCLAA